VINGRVVVAEGELTTMELPPFVARHNAISRAMIRGE
jgi:hypothetical protein